MKSGNVRRMSVTNRLGLAICIVGLCAGPAHSADWDVDVRTGLEFQGETDLDGPGDFDYWLLNLGIGTSGEIAPDVVFSMDGDYRAIGYDFSGLGFEPWETVHVVTLLPTIIVRATDELSILAGPLFEFSGETSADFGDSLIGGGRLAGRYRFADDLHITLGIVVASEIEDDAYVQPLVLVEWGITDDVDLGMVAESTRGGELRIGYTFLEDWKASIGGGFRRERFRLNDDNPNFREDGVGEEEATVISGRLAYAFSERMALEGYVGGTLDGEFKLDDSRGDRIIKSDYDDAVFGGVRFTFGF